MRQRQHVARRGGASHRRRSSPALNDERRMTVLTMEGRTLMPEFCERRVVSGKAAASSEGDSPRWR